MCSTMLGSIGVAGVLPVEDSGAVPVWLGVTGLHLVHKKSSSPLKPLLKHRLWVISPHSLHVT